MMKVITMILHLLMKFQWLIMNIKQLIKNLKLFQIDMGFPLLQIGKNEKNMALLILIGNLFADYCLKPVELERNIENN